MPRPPPRTLLDWLGLTHAPNWRVARLLGRIFGAILVGAAPLLFLASLLGSGVVVYDTIDRWVDNAPEGPNLGAGALIVALLGAPFLMWNTWLRHRALGFQKEGHITDRISKAVEQLGAEKTVKRRVTDAEGKEATAETTEPNIEVRIGGLLSLERIAQDSTAYDGAATMCG